MSDIQSLENIHASPGYICMFERAVQLCSVVSYGIAVTIYDFRKKRGGINHFIRPSLKEGDLPTGKFAKPAVHSLLKMFLSSGSAPQDLEAHIIGGSCHQNEDHPANLIANENIRMAEELLMRNNIKISTKDVGGHRGRKVIFNPLTGESMIAKVSQLRDEDWNIEALQNDCEYSRKTETA